MSNYGVISGSYFSVFNPNTGKYGPEITPYLDIFHTVHFLSLERFSGVFRGNKMEILTRYGLLDAKISPKNLKLPYKCTACISR